MEPVVVGTDGSPSAGRAVVWAAEDAALRKRPLRVVHATHLLDGPYPSPEVLGRPDPPDRVLADAVELATRRQPGLTVTGELLDGSASRGLRRSADRACEIVVGHRGRDGFAGLLLGSTSLRVAGHVPGPVVVVRGETMDAHGAVVVGVDGYAVCDAALDYACEAALLRNARLRVVEVWRVPSTLWQGGYPALIKLALADAADRLAKIVAPLRERFPGLDILDRAMPGHPVGTLCELSSSADLLVVGSRGLDPVRSAFGGSVSHGVLHHARCPVAVVRPDEPAAL